MNRYSTANDSYQTYALIHLDIQNNERQVTPTVNVVNKLSGKYHTGPDFTYNINMDARQELEDCVLKTEKQNHYYLHRSYDD